MIFSSVMSSPSTSPAMRPSRTTSTRSLTPMSSGNSEDMTITPTPSRASSLIWRWISAFAPTSTPRVGSSRKTTCGSTDSIFASATFCWLPPLKVETASPTLFARNFSRRPNSSARFISLRRSIKPMPFDILPTSSAETFATMDMLRNSPSPLRSSDR
ncbi:hypothetical protein D3C87_1274320 [compost metagenome]